jgi:hypothetical protein
MNIKNFVYLCGDSLLDIKYGFFNGFETKASQMHKVTPSATRLGLGGVRAVCAARATDEVELSRDRVAEIGKTCEHAVPHKLHRRRRGQEPVNTPCRTNCTDVAEAKPS